MFNFLKDGVTTVLCWATIVLAILCWAAKGSGPQVGPTWEHTYSNGLHCAFSPNGDVVVCGMTRPNGLQPLQKPHKEAILYNAAPVLI